MKQILNICTFFLLTTILIACQQEETDYHTLARVTLSMPDNNNIIQIQGTLTLQNINNTLNTSTADMNDNTFEITVLRGAYKVDVTGMVKYTEQNGTTHICYYRAHSDYTSFTSLPLSETELPIILLEE